MLHSAYGDLQKIRLAHAAKLLKHAFNLEREQVAWELWSGLYPQMCMGLIEFVPFEKFKDEAFEKVQRPSPVKITSDEIIEELERVEAHYRKGRAVIVNE